MLPWKGLSSSFPAVGESCRASLSATGGEGDLDGVPVDDKNASAVGGWGRPPTDMRPRLYPPFVGLPIGGAGVNGAGGGEHAPASVVAVFVGVKSMVCR